MRKIKAGGLAILDMGYTVRGPLKPLKTFNIKAPPKGEAARLAKCLVQAMKSR